MPLTASSERGIGVGALGPLGRGALSITAMICNAYTEAGEVTVARSRETDPYLGGVSAAILKRHAMADQG